MKKILCNGRKIAYQCHGSGPALVFLHGFMESQQIWNPLVEKLSPYGKIITIDLPGHGSSEGLGEIHTMKRMASLVQEVLDLEKVQNAFVVGHSMGGYVAAEFAHSFPKRCNGIAFFHSHAAKENEGGVVQRNRVIRLLEKNKKDFISSFIPDLFSEDNRQKLEPEIQQLIATAQNMKTEDIIAAQKGMRDREDRLDFLASTSLPVWFIHGKYDTRCRSHIVWEQALICQQAQVMILPTGHMGYLEAPDSVEEIFRGYLCTKSLVCKSSA